MATEELTQMSVLDEAALTSNLKSMFEKGVVYSRAGRLLVSLNPFRELPLYGEKKLEAYRTAVNAGALPPHIYGVAAEAHARLLERGRSQTIVISGESGAGKTENAKFVIQYLAAALAPPPPAAAPGGSAKGKLAAPPTASFHARLLRSNPLLEAFGCAHTEHNVNSSRYGKFVELRFDRTGKMAEARITTYLLEKSRVVQHGKHERAFTAMHTLVAGCTKKEATELSLSSKKFAYLDGGARAASDDAKVHKGVREAFDSLGVPAAEQAEVWTLVAAVLHCGNVGMADAKGAASADAGAAIADANSKKALGVAASLLGVDLEQLTDALLKQRMRAGTEWVTRSHSKEEALAARDALAKALYARLFDWLVRRISDSLQADSAAAAAAVAEGRSPARAAASPLLGPADGLLSPGAEGGARSARLSSTARGAPHLFIGIVDIFGFEVFQTNSLEQLCINYANERLQRLFVAVVIEEAQAQYKAEGIKVEAVEFEHGAGTQRCLELLEAKPAGVLPLLAEECILRTGSDKGLLEKLSAAHVANDRYVMRRDAPTAFVVKHFARDVEYGIEGFLIKNKDPLSQNVAVLMQKSSRALVATLFAPNGPDEPGATKPPPPAAGGARLARSASFQRTTRRGAGASSRFAGVADQFSVSLASLMRTIGASDVSFVRCFRPNGAQHPKKFEPELVGSQLATSGLVHAIKLARSAYPDSLPHAEVASRYGLLLDAKARSEPTKKGIASMLGALGVSDKQYALGNTRTFFKAGALSALEEKRGVAMAAAAEVLARMCRGLIARRMVAKLRNAAAERAAEEAIERQRREEEEAAKREKEKEASLFAEQEALLRKAQAQLEADAKAGKPLSSGGKGAAGARRAEAGARRSSDELPRVLRDQEGAGDAEGAPSAPLDPSEVGISFKQVMASYTLMLPHAPEGQKLSAGAKRLAASGLLGQLPLHAAGEELLRYAEYIGMDAERDWQLLWIADEALHTPAPPGWHEERDPTGGTYFKNVVTEDVSEQHPNTWSYQQLYFHERLQLLRQLAPHTLTREDLDALEQGSPSTFRASVLYNFGAEEAGEMSVRQGDVLTVLAGEVAPEGWWQAAYYRPGRAPKGEVGLVPQAYVQETVTVYAEQDGSPISPRWPPRPPGASKGKAAAVPRTPPPESAKQKLDFSPGAGAGKGPAAPAAQAASSNAPQPSAAAAAPAAAEDAEPKGSGCVGCAVQ